ncbi:hypothetical protein MtrunA17_Chr2g0291551 [Medicago truncatula]|uniref:Uncharacterized protein n=1 Tax=Medicago truncatula TaxID=3880 RepID=A0A396J8N3_MEDTR|nr:hypothetical protein MtrunA17_Chr2g0291551 [Medicago truncatula]
MNPFAPVTHTTSSLFSLAISVSASSHELAHNLCIGVAACGISNVVLI